MELFLFAINKGKRGGERGREKSLLNSDKIQTRSSRIQKKKKWAVSIIQIWNIMLMNKHRSSIISYVRSLN